MTRKVHCVLGLLVSAHLIVGAALCPAADSLDPALVDVGFAVLKTYDFGADRAPLVAIEQAVVASHKNAAAQKALQTRLTDVLKSGAARGAKDFACRQLSLIGSADSVEALAALLPDKDLSHMARYALERSTCSEAVAAMRDALPKVTGLAKVGVIHSLGVRRDVDSVAALTALLGDSDQKVARAAAAALGAIGTSEAAKALGAFQKDAPAELRLAAADACLACAERLLDDGKKMEAMMVYKALATADQPKQVRLAATRGLLAATGAKQ